MYSLLDLLICFEDSLYFKLHNSTPGQAHRRSRWAKTTGPYSDPYVGRKYNRNYNANTPYNAQYNRGYTGGTQSSAPFAGESQYMYQDLTGGLSEEEQLDRAVFESMQQPQSFRGRGNKKYIS